MKSLAPTTQHEALYTYLMFVTEQIWLPPNWAYMPNI